MLGTGSISSQSRSASTLIDGKILIDCGNGIVKTIPKQYVPAINVLLITHLHGDHFLDVIFLIFCRSFERMDNLLKIYGPRNTEKIVREIFTLTYPETNLVQLFERAKVQFIEFDSLQDEEVVPGYFVTSYPVKHGEILANGFTLRHSDTIVGFSGDSAYCENIDHILDRSNVAILDSSFMTGSEVHMGLDILQQLLQKYPKTLIIPTHMCDDVRQAAQALNHANLIVPQDGQEITVEPNSML